MEKLKNKEKKEALNPLWQNAKWNVTGMFTQAKFLIPFIEEVEKRLQIRPICYVHGCPLGFKWNGGRVDFRISATREEVDWIMAEYKRLNMACFLTFSNRFLTKKDLTDYNCNYLLDKLAAQENPENGVIVVSDLLADYIEKKYPELKKMASIIKVTCDQAAGNLDYYKSLEMRFDRYVVAVDDNWNYELLNQLDNNKVEILVNSRCILHCPHKAEHYDRMAGMHENHSFADQNNLDDFQIKNCKAYPIPRQLLDETRNYTLTHEELHKLYSMGFRYFKLQGRYTASTFSVLYDMATYIFEPRYTAALIFHSFG